MPSPRSNIRKLTKDDVAIYRDLRLEALKNVPDAFGMSYEEEVILDDAETIRRLENGAMFGAFAGDELAGMMGYFPDNHIKCAHIATVYGVYVKPEYRGQGLSEDLFAAIMDDLPEKIEQIRISVGAHNDPARKLYERLGFTPCGFEEKVLKIGDQYFDEIPMVQFLKTGDS